MTEGGDIDKLGRGTIWEGQIPNCLHQNHVFRVRTNPKLLDSYFFSYLVESDLAKRYFFKVAKRTTNLASINKTQLQNFIFSVPPMEEQKEFVEVTKASKNVINSLMRKISAYEKIQNTLMHDLLIGEVRINDL